MTIPPRYAYLHGFASGPLARKAVQLAAAFEARGLVLERPDLNRPSFAALTFTGALAAVDALVTASGGPWCLVGSSMGGAIAALYANANPERVARLVLLCPGFGLADRWPAVLGADVMKHWRETGTLVVPDGAGTPTALHYRFVEDSATYLRAPSVSCPTLVFHGQRDETIPIESSRAWVAAHPNATLIELDDDHRLLASAAQIGAAALDFFLT